MLEKMRKGGECGMEKFGTLDSSEKTIAVPGDRWWPQTAKQKGDKISKIGSVYYVENTVLSAQMLEVSLLGVGTVLHLERNAWSMVK